MIESPTLPLPGTAQRGDQRLRDLLALHCHPDLGSTYWLGRQERLGWSVCARVRTLADLWLLGPTPVDDLRRHPVDAFIPRALHAQRSRFILGETAGTSGAACPTAYRDDEFHAAFVTPFLRAAAATGFPRELPWLWVGPSGPHVIGKAARELARHMGSMEPFSVDFDPRWAKRLAEGSLGRRRYLEHVVSQALDVLRREDIGVIFTTPPTLAALADEMRDHEREAIRGIHYGGMSLTPAEVNRFRALFPNAVHLSGYGNTLFGVVMEVEDGPREALDYYPLGERVLFEIVAGDESEGPPRRVAEGATGRVLFHRLDESFFLPGVLERDEAERVAPGAAAQALGVTVAGLRNPRPPATLARSLRVGLY
jgi:hypothetical protein